MASNTAPKAQSKASKPVARKKAAGIAVPKAKPQGVRKASTPVKKGVQQAPSRTPKAAALKTKVTHVAPKQEQSKAPAPLNERQKRFVDEYMVDLNATQAAIRAGYSVESAALIGHENLRKPNIQERIAFCRKEQQERTGIKADKVLLEIAQVALADARELIEVRVGCCRSCYGEGHKYQRTVGEMNRDREAWEAKGKSLADFDVQGGIGYERIRPPFATCPACAGDGAARVVARDTRFLSPMAAALYAGAKETKEGFEVKMHSKMDALEKLAKHVGLYQLDNEQKTDPLKMLLHTIAQNSNSSFQPVADDPERTPAKPKSSAFQPVDDDVERRL